jgi:pilus assembly protein FimV
MVRKLALAVSLALGTVTVPAHALGLGELNSKSALNQNFNGDIGLLSVDPDELDTLRVALADAAAFARAGVERPYFLSQMQFRPMLDSGGRPVIRVSSDFPIREPFLNFLVEVNWPNGRLLREYTVLLDPPTTTSRRPPQVTPAARSAAPQAVVRQPAAAPSAPVQQAAAPRSSQPGQYQVRPNDTAWSIARQLRPAGVSMEQMMMGLLRANPEAFVDGNINRLRRGQILRVPVPAELQELSREQARLAYREQQDAWLAQRDARLQAAAAGGEAEAQAEAQSEAVPGSETAAAAGDANDRLRIATARPEGEGVAGAAAESAETGTPDLGSRLMMAREEAESSRQEAENLRSQVDDLQDRLRDMQRLLSLKDEQLASLQGRLSEEAESAPATVDATSGTAEEPTPVVAEEQAPVVAEEAASVAAQAPAAGESATPDVVLGNVVDLSLDEAPTAEAPLAADAAPAFGDAGSPFAYERIEEIPPQIDPDRIVMASMAAPEPAVVEVAPAAESGAAVDVLPVADPTLAAAPAEAAAVLVEPVATDSGPAAESGDAPLIPAELSALLEQNMVPIALGGVLVLALIGWVATRGRRGPAEPEPLLAAGAADLASPAVDRPAAAPKTLDELPDSALLDDFSPSELNALQDETGEVDPVSEADVYIAYGRYQQAEELLSQAMERDPGRLALRHKMLEVHYATRNADKFAALAGEMAQAGQDAVDEEAWVRAQDMGRELQPDNPLFALDEAQSERRGIRHAGTAVLGGAAAMVDEDTLSLDELELSELKAAYDEADSQASQLDVPSEVSILLDLDEASALAAHPAQQVPEAIPFEEVESLDFSLPVDEQPVAERRDQDTVSDAFDLDSMMAQAEAAVDAEETSLSLDSVFTAEDLQAQLDELSDLSALDSAFEEGADELAAEPRRNLGLVAEDKSDLPSGLDAPLELDRALAGDDPVGEGAEILQFEPMHAAATADDADDVTTKLDLARAYYEMGDEDGARSILEEVVAEGNDIQRDDAERLLSKLG